MQASYGESQIVVNGSNLGRVRVLSVHPLSALYPRIGLRLGVTLHESDVEFLPGRPRKRFSIRVPVGEFRLSEHGDVIGPVYSLGGHDVAESSIHAHERQVELACDLDEARLEQIEVARDGGPPTFWIAAWPVVADSTGSLPLLVQCSPIRTDVPRDSWIAVLSKLQRRRIALLEVSFSPAEVSRFEAAISHIRHAHERIRVGEYDDTLLCCRRALEALSGSLQARSAAEITELLSRAVGDRQSSAYASIYSQLKALANATVHRGGPSELYSRAEARFAVSLAEQLIMLCGALTSELEGDEQPG